MEISHDDLIVLVDCCKVWTFSNDKNKPCNQSSRQQLNYSNCHLNFCKSFTLILPVFTSTSLRISNCTFSFLYLQIACHRCLDYRTWWWACRSSGRWRQCTPCCLPQSHDHSGPRTHPLVPWVSQSQASSARHPKKNNQQKGKISPQNSWCVLSFWCIKNLSILKHSQKVKHKDYFHSDTQLDENKLKKKIKSNKKRHFIPWSSKPQRSSYLEFALTGEDANPFVIIVCNDDVTARVNSHSCGTLQLPWRPSTHPKTTLKFPLIGENLQGGDTCKDPQNCD